MVNQIQKYSIDTRNLPTTVNSFYKKIEKNLNIATGLQNTANLGFYYAGKLMNKAKKELKTDFGQLQKQLQNKGYHIKQQQRHMRIARNKYINEHFKQMPKEWTFWERLSQLYESDRTKFNSVKHLVSPEASWKDITQALGKKHQTPRNKKKQGEVFSIYTDSLKFYKADKRAVKQFQKDLIKLVKKHKYLKLEQHELFNDFLEFGNKKKLEDDTTATSKKEFKGRYSAKKKINI